MLQTVQLINSTHHTLPLLPVGAAPTPHSPAPPALGAFTLFLEPLVPICSQ